MDMEDMEDAEMDGDYLLGLDNKSDDLPQGDSQKLKLALKKRQIVEEERGRLHKVVQDIRMRHAEMEKIPGAHLKLLEDDPFVKFYLEIYRELCGKKTIDEITREVFGRWKKMKRKPRTTLRKTYTDPHVTYGLAWELAFGEKQMNDTNHLKFALMKNKIVSEEMTRLASFVRNMHKEKKCSIPFLKTYLKVFREMCGKSNIREICGEAMRRFINEKQSKPESKAELKMKIKSKKALRSGVFGKRRKSHECPTHGRAGRKQYPDQSMVPREKCLYHRSAASCSGL